MYPRCAWHTAIPLKNASLLLCLYYYSLYGHAEIKIHSHDKISFFPKQKSLTAMLWLGAKASSHHPAPAQIHTATRPSENHAGGCCCHSQTLWLSFLLLFFFFYSGQVHCDCLLTTPVARQVSIPVDLRSYPKPSAPGWHHSIRSLVFITAS